MGYNTSLRGRSEAARWRPTARARAHVAPYGWSPSRLRPSSRETVDCARPRIRVIDLPEYPSPAPLRSTAGTVPCSSSLRPLGPERPPRRLPATLSLPVCLLHGMQATVPWTTRPFTKRSNPMHRQKHKRKRNRHQAKSNKLIKRLRNLERIAERYGLERMSARYRHRMIATRKELALEWSELS